MMKLHETDEGVVAAVCDAELLGRKFEEGDVVLHVKSSFFGGERASASEVARAVRKCLTANIVGEKAVSALVREGVISEDGVLEVAGQKHAHVFRL